jgi:hypothetical protein
VRYRGLGVPRLREKLSREEQVQHDVIPPERIEQERLSVEHIMLIQPPVQPGRMSQQISVGNRQRKPAPREVRPPPNTVTESDDITTWAKSEPA